jgi:hypothetical protein
MDWALGMMDSDARVELVPPPPPPVTVTEIALLVMRPPKPFMLAVMVAVPAPSPVTTPVELTVATEVALEDQVAVAVTLVLLAGWLPWPTVPSAVNCAVAPAATLTLEGETAIESTVVEEPQPARAKMANVKTGLAKNNTFTRQRFRINFLAL